jgi:hypothetical protein
VLNCRSSVEVACEPWKLLFGIESFSDTQRIVGKFQQVLVFLLGLSVDPVQFIGTAEDPFAAGYWVFSSDRESDSEMFNGILLAFQRSLWRSSPDN